MSMKPYSVFLISSVVFLFASHSAGAALVNPVGGINSSVMPVGIASYGLYNIPNDSGPYQIETNSIVGFARINSIHAYNASPPNGSSEYGATIQLNVVLNITGRNGADYSYWIQDVADLNTSNMTYTIGDNIWNMTSINGSVGNTTVSGIGITAPMNQTYNMSAPGPDFYVYFPNASVSYRYPLYFIPIVNIKMAGGHPVAQIGYQGNGGADAFFDNVTFNISAENAYLLVTPYYETPAPAGGLASGNFYDSELILAGEGSGEVSQFSGTNASLWMGYSDHGVLTPFPTVADFGSDTQEGAGGLSVGEQGGNITVAQGQINYNETLTQYGVPSVLGNSTAMIAPAIMQPVIIQEQPININTSTLTANASFANSVASSSLVQNILNGIENFFLGLFGKL